MNTKLDDVKNFWNLESCGERYTSDVDKFEFYKQQSTLRYELEPYIKDFAEFKKFTASFATPTMMSKTAKINSTTTAINNISIPITDILSNQDRSAKIGDVPHFAISLF